MAGGEDGGATPVDYPPEDGEVVYADEMKILCRRWNWRQDARSLVTTATSRAVVTLQYNGADDLDTAMLDLAELIARSCGGIAEVAIADHSRPTAQIG